jgi:hypothetical protein
MEKRIVPETLFSSEVNGFKDIEDFLLIQKAYQRFLKTFLRDIDDPLGQFPMIRMHQADHFGKGFECVETDIPGFRTIVSSLFKILQECDDELRRDVLHSERFDLDTIIFCCKGQEDLEGVTVRFDGVRAHPPNVFQILMEKLMNAG